MCLAPPTGFKKEKTYVQQYTQSAKVKTVNKTEIYKGERPLECLKSL